MATVDEKSNNKKSSQPIVMLRLVFSRYLGFALIQCWVLVAFSSPLLFGESQGMPVPTLHMIASIFSIATAVTILLLCGRGLVPICKRTEAGMVMGILGMIGTLATALVAGGYLARGWEYVGFSCIAVAMTWLTLSWQEYFATEGARNALLLMAVETVLGAVLLFLLGLLPGEVAAWVAVALPLAGQLCLRPRTGVTFLMPSKQSGRAVIGIRNLCALIAHDYSPRVMTICALAALVYSGVRSQSAPLIDPSNQLTWLESAAALSVSALVAYLAITGVKQKGLSKALYVALPVGAVGVIAASSLVGKQSMASLLFATVCYNIANYVVWVFMIERSYKKKLPVLGLFASLWSACFTGVLAGQMLDFLWSSDYTMLSYVYLLALLAAALLMAGIGDKLTVSEAALASPSEGARGVRAVKLADECGLSSRETEVMLIWVSGHNGEYIEKTLNISGNTVKTHLSHIYQKTGTSGREDLLRRIDQVS